ncbi:MAG: methionyl-tRNA formyltransferase [Bacillota bacterium]|nr:methionyl-tRNA formyltransferase [Bacillota bacterium]
MKIFFMGATKFGFKCMLKAINLGFEIVGCAYTPKVFNISYAPKGVNNINYFDFAEAARQFNIPCISYDKDNIEDFNSRVKSLEPDLIIVAGWYYMLPKLLREIAPKGVIGLHASLLPRYRGGAPLVWAMINGEKYTGLSMFYISQGVDTGDIIGQESFEIGESDTIADLLVKTEAAAEVLLEKYLPLMATDKAPRIKQKESDVTIYPQRSPKDGEIDWSWEPQRIRNFIRAQTHPYPGAFTVISGKKIIIWDADIIEE